MTFRELDRLIRADGWVLKSVVGSHYHYVHPEKAGKVTIPRHKGDIPLKTAKSILKQAGLE